MFQINSIAKQLIHPGNARGSIYKFDSLWTYRSIWPLDHEDQIKFAMQAGSPWWHLYNIHWWPLILAKVKCLASIARIKCVLWFYPFKKQNNAFLTRAKTKSQIGQKLPKMQPQGLKIKIIGGPIPPKGGSPPPSQTYPNLALHAKMVAMPPFLVPAVATIIFLFISSLYKNPGVFPNFRKWIMAWACKLMF